MTPKEAFELFDYCPSTGKLVWKVNQGRAVKCQAAGTATGTHIAVTYKRTSYPVTTLIWLLVYGRKPLEGMVIDHKNQNPKDNRIDNLREITHSQNLQNRGAQVNNALGIKGVCYHKASGKYLAYISVDKVRIHLGLHLTPSAASAAYTAAAEKYHTCTPTLT